MNQTINRTIAVPEPIVLSRRIGSTIYNIGIYFNPEATETLDDKALRLINNDLNLAPQNVTMGLSQTGWLPEGSSL